MIARCKYVDENGYYFDNGYDNNKQRIMVIMKMVMIFSCLHAKIMKQQSDLNGAPCHNKKKVHLIK